MLLHRPAHPPLWQVCIAGIFSFEWLLMNKAPIVPVTRGRSLLEKVWLGRMYLLSCFVLAGAVTGSPSLF